MSLELFLDFLLSFVVLYVHHSDCHRTPAYACVSAETPLFAPVHREFHDRYVSPEDYESTSYLVQPDDVWVADPMDTDDLDLVQLFKLADAIEPMEADVAAELAALDAEVDALCPPTPVEAPVLVAMLESMVLPVSSKTKAAAAPQLRSLAIELGLESVGKKAVLNEMVLNAFADRGIGMYEVGGILFKPSADDTVMNILT